MTSLIHKVLFDIGFKTKNLNRFYYLSLLPVFLKTKKTCCRQQLISMPLNVELGSKMDLKIGFEFWNYLYETLRIFSLSSIPHISIKWSGPLVCDSNRKKCKSYVDCLINYPYIYLSAVGGEGGRGGVKDLTGLLFLEGVRWERRGG